MTSKTSDAAAEAGLVQSARKLLTASAVRERAQRMLRLAREGALADWTIDEARLAPTADFVATVIRERHPHLNPPMHARWRHFMFDGRDLWREMSAAHAWRDRAAQARAAFDLAITSVLLDAGAGMRWRYHDALTGLVASRSEGLALASLRWFANGGMSQDARDPLRADAAPLSRLSAAALESAFQVSEQNPLAGASGRAQLLNRLGATLSARADLFALEDSPRPGGLFDVIAHRAAGNSIPAAGILEVVLEALGPIWQGRPSLGGAPLGDCWPHPAFNGPAPTDAFVPLHKLSQWLSYSLIEPLQAAGITVRDLDGLTGLAEYRNGGLFIDLDVLVPRNPGAALRGHAVADPFVVGWRSLTVALLDEIAPLVRQRLGVSAAQLPLASLLEGGTWAAGRIIAREKRSDGGPPLQIVSDGTVF